MSFKTQTKLLDSLKALGNHKYPPPSFHDSHVFPQSSTPASTMVIKSQTNKEPANFLPSKTCIIHTSAKIGIVLMSCMIE